ncbi:GntR family transcriptional regulator [Microbacterium abyssi]|uniref:GntR family transcriptional regulator n=1 Tax=Microbacterium abyssi TaxID=2782166 RepID=UPI0018885A03|nr:GntR family transcriptional regulator [Microbacterium sp. A18JL241]
MGERSAELESARVARQLRDDIVLGRRRPGSRLVERDIAAQLSVSRLPVREAIRTLVTEGIVVARPRTWAVVREYTLDDVRDFAEVRAPIETMLFVYAAERHDEAGLDGLRRVLEREERAAHDGDPAASQAAAGDFHSYMAVLAGNDVLTELAGVFATRLKWIFGLHQDPHSMAVSHRELFEAIEARDADLVRRLLAEHLAAGAAAAERRFGAGSASTL